MDPKRGVVFTDAVGDGDVVRLLEADAVPVEIAHHAILNHAVETTVEENATTAAAVQGLILLLIAVDRQVLDTGAFNIIATNDRKERGGFRSVVHQASGMIMIQLGVEIYEALSRLRAFAFAEGRSVTDVARDVVARALRFNPGDV